MFLNINEDHHIKLCMNVGHGTNSRAELVALWGLLQFASLIGIDSMWVSGGSKVIMDWENGTSDL